MTIKWLRNFTLIGMFAIAFALFIRWNSFQEQHPVVTASNNTTSSVNTSASPSPAPPSGNEEFQAPTSNAAVTDTGNVATNSIQIKTDTFDITLDTLGGDISRIALPKYLAKQNSGNDPFVLFDNSQHPYLVRSGLAGPNGTDGQNTGRPQFTSAHSHYQLEDGENQLIVDLNLQQTNAQITKRFIFTRNSYLVELQYHIKNTSDQPWQASLIGSLKRDSYNPTPSSLFAMNPFLGAALTTDHTNYEKYSFDTIAKKPVKEEKTGGWVALIQHYFVAAWVPPSDSKNTFVLQKLGNNDLYTLSFTTEPILVAAGGEKTIKAQFYAGPKDIRTLESISRYLDLTMDYSFLWWLAKPLFFIMSAIHAVVGNWGIAIILLTLLVKIAFFYPSAISYKSMAKMRNLQPKMAALKDKYGEDRQRMSQELMKLYKQEKINPVSGCLPILIQMPVFMALYWVLMEAVELRHAPFYLWITDLSVKDPYFILPLLMGVTMFIQQKLNPTPPDPMQAKMMQMMPIFFTFLFVFFPSGLVLYWVVNNTLSIAQQYVITQQIEKSARKV